MSTKKNDFDVNALAESSGKHEEEISNLKNRIKSLEDKFGDNEKISTTLSETAKTQVGMKTMLESILLDLIKKDDGVKKEIKIIVDKIDRHFLKSLAHKIGFAGWSIFLVVLGAVVTFFLKPGK